MEMSDDDFKRIRLFKLPAKRSRGRPYKIKTGLRGRPRKFPCGTLEIKEKSRVARVFFESNAAMVKIDNLSPSFVKVLDKHPTKSCNCKLYIYFQIITICSNIINTGTNKPNHGLPGLGPIPYSRGVDVANMLGQAVDGHEVDGDEHPCMPDDGKWLDELLLAISEGGW